MSQFGETVSMRFPSRGDDGRVAVITIERAAKLNTLDQATIVALTRAATALHGDDALRAVVLTGAGERAFIGGADIHAMAVLDPDAAEAFITSLHAAIAAIRAIPAPVIARVNGFCLGAGLEIAAGCDLRVASANAVFAMPEVKVGIPSVIEAALLPRLIGWGHATRLLLLGETIDAEEAVRIGLVSRVTPQAALDDAVEAWLGSIVAAGPRAVRTQKALMRQWMDLSVDAAIAAGIAAFRESYHHDEPRRMMRSFIDRKRTPQG